jgi:hypothetical protein
MILSGAGLIEGSDTQKIPVHVAETTDKVYLGSSDDVYIITEQALSAHKDASFYVMVMKDGEIDTEPFIGKPVTDNTVTIASDDQDDKDAVDAALKDKKLLKIHKDNYPAKTGVTPIASLAKFTEGCVVMVDYYTDKGTGAQQIDITPDKFGGNYYLEASTLFRDTNGVDMPAEFIIPNCKI